MELYNLVVKGRTFHFEGDIPEDKYEQVEAIANSIEFDVDFGSSNEAFAGFCQQFIEEVQKTLNIELKRKNIAGIFRVRDKG